MVKYPTESRKDGSKMKVRKIDLFFDNRDPRGFVIQNLQESRAFEGHCIKDIVIQSIMPDKDRGYHSHMEKTEWFLALSGEAKLISSEKMDPKNPDLEHEPLKADCLKPTYALLIPPRLTHWIVNDSEQVFVMASFSSKEHDPKDDTKYAESVWRPITELYFKSLKKNQSK